MFKQKKDKFSLLLEAIALNLKNSAYYFADYKPAHAGDFKNFSEHMKRFETKSNKYIYDIITELHHTFITPIDREDILALATDMDNILNKLNEAAGLFELYSIAKFDDYMEKFAETIRSCTVEMVSAVNLLSIKKLPSIRRHAIKMKEYKIVCSGVHHQAIQYIFTIEKDPIRLIKVKEIYRILDDIADLCKKAANTLEAIIMKNA